MNIKITEATIKGWPNILDKIFKWNENKNLLLYAHNGHMLLYHAGMLSKFNRLYENKTVNFNVQLPYYQTDYGAKFIPPLRFKQLAQNTDSNILMVVQYIEPLTEDFIICKNDNLKNYKMNFDKEIIVLELHSSLLSNNSILDQIEIYNEEYMYNTDFSKFNKQFTKINSKIIKIGDYDGR